MKNKWLIQSSGFQTSYIEDVISALNELKIDWVDFGIIKNELTNLENIPNDGTNYIIRGGTSLLRILDNETAFLKDGLDYDEQRCDQEFYGKLNLPLLNNDPEIYTVNNLLHSEFTKDEFIKPSKDSKAFNGGIIYAGETLSNFLMRTPHRNIEDIGEDTVIVAPLQKIKEEFRFFMHKDEVLGSSRYMVNGKVDCSKYVPQDLIDKAKEYGKLYNPSDIYVMDLCTFEDSDDIKIVEYNCWNCSGFYHCDIKAIIKAIDLIKS